MCSVVLLFLPGFSARSALREQHYMTGGGTRNPFAIPGLSWGNVVLGIVAPRLYDRSPGPGDRGFGVVGAEAEGFEPSMGFKTQTALAVRRHRPD